MHQERSQCIVRGILGKVVDFQLNQSLIGEEEMECIGSLKYCKLLTLRMLEEKMEIWRWNRVFVTVGES